MVQLKGYYAKKIHKVTGTVLKKIKKHGKG